jgi:hypothetical protein
MGTHTNQTKSFLVYIKDISALGKWAGFLISFGYPLQSWFLFKLTNKRKSGLSLGIAALFVLPSLGILFRGAPSILGALGVIKPPLWQQFLWTFLFIVAINVGLFVVLAAFDLPALFTVTGSTAVWEWEETIIGHKLWSGEKTYHLLEWLTADTAKLGRVKWLLVNFLADDLDRRIRQNQNSVLYEISVHGWPTILYSEFLAKNMTHARDSILWTVDPRDFIRDILPAHVFEVLISICSHLDSSVKEKLRRASNAPQAGENLRNLLGEDYARFCPLLFYAQCDKRSNCIDPPPDFSCPKGFTFKGENRQKEFEHLWFSFFVAALKRLETASSPCCGILKVGENNVEFKHMREAYRKRESVVGSLVLPHIDEFRRASCYKRRHVYLGIRPTTGQTAVARATENIRTWLSVDGSYIDSVFPEVNTDRTEYSLFKSPVQLKKSEDENSRVGLDCQKMKSQWEKVNANVKRLLLEWAIDLFAETSGGKNIVSGVFATNRSPGRTYHDVGIYDRKLEVSSELGNGRRVVWKVFADGSPLREAYFPDDRALIVPFEVLKASFRDALC